MVVVGFSVTGGLFKVKHVGGESTLSHVMHVEDVQ